ncbi:MAG: lysophospholipid acyltransferase family protein [Acidimicrobiales bacterium]
MKPSIEHSDNRHGVGAAPVASNLLDGIDLDAVGRHYWATRRISLPWRRMWLRVELEGAESVPASGPVILAPNHLSFLDSMVLMYELPRPVTFLGKAEYLAHPVTRRLFPAAGMIPVDRSGRGVAASLRAAAKRLEAGGIVGLFPEGTRSRDGLLHDGHLGVAHLALHTGAPIVPVGIIGTDLVQPPDRRLPRRGDVRVRFGAPIDLGRWAGRGRSAGVKREITDELMDAIAALSGQARAAGHAVPVERTVMVS